MNKNILIVIIAIVVLLAALSLYYFFLKPASPAVEEKGGQGTQFEDVGKALENPLADMPSINPLEDVVNPFETEYKNPFK